VAIAPISQRFMEAYFSTFPGKYFAGDGVKRDVDGYYWITGRVDDLATSVLTPKYLLPHPLTLRLFHSQFVAQCQKMADWLNLV
jgi:hypothetical protein